LVGRQLPVPEELGQFRDGFVIDSLKGWGFLEGESLPGGGEDTVGFGVKPPDQSLGLIVVEGVQAEPELGSGVALLEGSRGGRIEQALIAGGHDAAHLIPDGNRDGSSIPKSSAACDEPHHGSHSFVAFLPRKGSA
jgi:hypothetical protein